ncbi:hypothetical protein BDQ12DRAFT_730165 [Crucibulum laeve]|uniref:FAD/NAD(P)-binding domain-containing protein n=1 Tax=Crucibulum laeve TaxID=68775 RepID=A0A5C3MFA8_9AGAR|nr:hypothetical protein BDQ12DRAFT_730165 [Crucibulum laeve]
MTTSTGVEFITDHPLPTLSFLNATLPEDIDGKAVAQAWFAEFSKAAAAIDAKAVAALFLPGSFWRDMLAFTWDFRTFSGIDNILPFLESQLSVIKPHNFKLDDELLGLQRPFEDVAWVHGMFTFSTATGEGSGVFRLVPTANGEWKAHVLYTNLEALKGFPEKIGPLRNQNPNHGLWGGQRAREIDFVNKTPQVLVVGAGQSGLELAARLKYLDVEVLIVERNERVGDNWRHRYEALCLHDPVWYDHMPYLPFPPTWPVYAPALKLANWLEHYAEILELNVWLSSKITSVKQDPSTGKWSATITRGDGKERKFEGINHVVFATGLGSGLPNTPHIDGMEKFKGKILHSSEHKRAEDHKGKKVIIVGACTSAHDIAVDYYNHGIDVTMFQRGSTYIMSTENGWKVLMEGVYSENAPPVEVADRLNASFPHHMAVPINQRSVKRLAELDKDILDSLRAVGFRLNFGIKETGFSLLAWSKAGGYYLDTGGSALIAEGKIKLKNDSQIKEFTETGLRFDDGSELNAEVVVFATGLGDPREHIRRLCGDDVASRCGPIWGLNKEGELNGVWRDLGVKGLWYMMGNLALCRFHSKHVALQIKAVEEGVFGERYSLKE